VKSKLLKLYFSKNENIYFLCSPLSLPRMCKAGMHEKKRGEKRKQIFIFRRLFVTPSEGIRIEIYKQKSPTVQAG